MKSHEQPPFSYGFPVFLWFSYGLPPMETLPPSARASRAKMAFHMPKSSRLAKSRPRSASCDGSHGEKNMAEVDIFYIYLLYRHVYIYNNENNNNNNNNNDNNDKTYSYTDLYKLEQQNMCIIYIYIYVS